MIGCHSQCIRTLLIVWSPSAAIILLLAGPAAANDRERIDIYLQRYCVDCHGDTEPAGDLRLDTLRGSAPGSDGEIWLRVFEQVASGNMPPKGEPRPDRIEAARVLQSLHGLLTELGHDDELQFPDKGNHVPHELLFGPLDPKLPPPASPARWWRLSPSQYDALTLGVAGQTYRYERTFATKAGALPTPFSTHGGPGLQNYSSLYRIDEAQTEQMLLNAREAARRIFALEKDFRPPKTIGVYVDRESLTSEDRTTLVGLYGPWVFKREFRDEERTRYIEFFAQQCERYGTRSGMENLLAAMLLHPESVYRLEAADGKPDKHGRVRLDPLSLARALSYALSDAGPDRKLLEVMVNGRFQTRDDLLREADRLYELARFTKDTRPTPKPLHRFFQEFFGYTAAPDVFKDDELLRPEPRMYLVRDTDRLVYLLLQEDRQVLREMLTTNRSYVMVDAVTMSSFRTAKEKQGATNPFRKMPVNEPYNLTAEDWREDQPLTFAKDRRRGILMQPSWLIAHSQNGINDAVRRGKWVRERLLGGAIPDTPITVDAQLPDEPQETLRHRMRVTREEYCWKCHERMDPLGLTFEMFDDWGRFRTEELGKPIDTHGAIIDAADERLNGPVRDAFELVERLAHSDYVEQVFVRHAFRFWMGRNETPRDAPVLQAAWRAYHDNDGSMKQLVLSLLASDAFLYRAVDDSSPKR